MSATAYQNPYQKHWWDVATQGLGAPKQDTGWDYTPNTLPGSVDYAAPGGISPNTPPGGSPYAPNGSVNPGWSVLTNGQPGGSTQSGGTVGSSPFGYSYSSPGQGWNPWTLYDGGEAYKGGDGIYNVAADTKKGWGPNGQGETDRDRVWRMTLDDLKAQNLDPGSADPAKVQAAFLNNVARLHRDYRDTQGLGEQAWANSAFSGYDKYLAGGAGGQAGTATQQGGTRGQGGTSPAAATIAGATQALGDATKTGGSNVDPSYLGPQPTGATPAGGAALPPPPTTNPTNPATPAGLYYKTDPSVAVTQFLQQHNVGTGDHGPFAEFLRTLAGKVAPTVMSVLGNTTGQMASDRLNTLPSFLNNLIYGNGGAVGSNLAGFANQSMGQFDQAKLHGMTPDLVQGLLSTINALRSFGDNPYMQGFNDQALKDMFAEYKKADLNKAMSPAGGSLGGDWFLNPTNDQFGLFR